MIARAPCEAAFRQAVQVCDPAQRVRESLARESLGDRDVYAIAVGKAALAMARGAGPVARGIAVAPVLDGAPLPLGWTARDAAHPEPDPRSLDAGDAVIDVVTSAGAGDVVLALISGGASSLIERPAAGVTLEELRDEIRVRMHSGAPIHAINARRTELSAIKGGKLARMCAAPVVTLAISDVFDDDIEVIGSGPTIARRPGDVARVIASMSAFAEAMRDALGPRFALHALGAEDVAVIADRWANVAGFVGWGEPSVHVPRDHGVGGRAQQLALELAERFRELAAGGEMRAAFVAGSDGIDGPPPPDRPAPAGAYVDYDTWDAMLAAGLDPERALARCDAGTALHAVGALVVTGPTGVNHADVVLIG